MSILDNSSKEANEYLACKICCGRTPLDSNIDGIIKAYTEEEIRAILTRWEPENNYATPEPIRGPLASHWQTVPSVRESNESRALEFILLGSYIEGSVVFLSRRDDGGMTFGLGGNNRGGESHPISHAVITELIEFLKGKRKIQKSYRISAAIGMKKAMAILDSLSQELKNTLARRICGDYPPMSIAVDRLLRCFNAGELKELLKSYYVGITEEEHREYMQAPTAKLWKYNPLLDQDIKKGCREFVLLQGSSVIFIGRTDSGKFYFTCARDPYSRGGDFAVHKTIVKELIEFLEGKRVTQDTYRFRPPPPKLITRRLISTDGKKEVIKTNNPRYVQFAKDMTKAGIPWRAYSARGIMGAFCPAAVTGEGRGEWHIARATKVTGLHSDFVGSEFIVYP